MAFDLRTITKRQAFLILGGLSFFFAWWAVSGRDLLIMASQQFGLLGRILFYYASQYGVIVYFFYLAVKRRNGDG